MQLNIKVWKVCASPRQNSCPLIFCKIVYKCISAQKIKFSIKDLFCKCDQIRRKLRIWWPDLVTFTEEIRCGKLHFLCSVFYLGATVNFINTRHLLLILWVICAKDKKTRVNSGYVIVFLQDSLHEFFGNLIFLNLKQLLQKFFSRNHPLLWQIFKILIKFSCLTKFWCGNNWQYNGGP